MSTLQLYEQYSSLLLPALEAEQRRRARMKITRYYPDTGELVIVRALASVRLSPGWSAIQRKTAVRILAAEDCQKRSLSEPPVMQTVLASVFPNP